MICLCLGLIASIVASGAPDAAALEAVARRAMGERSGTVLVLRVRDGRIIACSDRRRAFEEAHPPGSILKVVTALAALETHVTDARARIECRPRMTANENMLCTIPRGHGRLTLADALGQSCNVHFQELGRRLPPGALHEWAARLGFGEPTGLAPPGCEEVAGALPPPGSTLHRVKQAIGQGGILATPSQVAACYRSVASGQSATGRICSPQTLATVRQGLRRAVTSGTAQRAQPSNVPVAGKTGTPELSPESAARCAWFAGYAPAERPQIVVVVFVERGRGGLHAAPVARAVLEAYFRDE